MATGRPLQNHLEAIVAGDGTAGWWATSKARFLADDGSVLGIVCLSVALAPLRPQTDETQHGLAELLKALKAAPGEQWRIADMCDASGLTRQQLERAVEQSFNLAPTQLLLRVRIEESMHMLSHGDFTLADLALPLATLRVRRPELRRLSSAAAITFAVALAGFALK